MSTDARGAEWDATINTNLTGTYTMISAMYPYFKKQGGGRIVNVSSVAGKIGGGNVSGPLYVSFLARFHTAVLDVVKERPEGALQVAAAPISPPA